MRWLRLVRAELRHARAVEEWHRAGAALDALRPALDPVKHASAILRWNLADANLERATQALDAERES